MGLSVHDRWILSMNSKQVLPLDFRYGLQVNITHSITRDS